MNMKLHVERACLVNRMNIARLSSTNATLVIRPYKIFVRSYMDYACALKALKKTQRHGLEVIQSRCLRYARRVVDSTSISNKDILGTSIFGLSPFFVTMNEHEITYRKGMFCKQNEYCKTKFN